MPFVLFTNRYLWDSQCQRTALRTTKVEHITVFRVIQYCVLFSGLSNVSLSVCLPRPPVSTPFTTQIAEAPPSSDDNEDDPEHRVAGDSRFLNGWVLCMCYAYDPAPMVLTASVSTLTEHIKCMDQRPSWEVYNHSASKDTLRASYEP